MGPIAARTAAGRCLLLLTSLLFPAATGCHGTRVEEAEHHTPAHKPADFPAAVDRLLALHSEISSGVHRESAQIDVFTEFQDLVRWLPELAADSDLGEESWNAVYDTTQRLEKILIQVQSRGGEHRRETYLTYENEWNQHQRVLAGIKRQFPASSKSVVNKS